MKNLLFFGKEIHVKVIKKIIKHFRTQKQVKNQLMSNKTGNLKSDCLSFGFFTRFLSLKETRLFISLVKAEICQLPKGGSSDSFFQSLLSSELPNH